MRLLRRLLTGALIIAALAPAASDAYSGESVAIEGVRSSYLPERTYGDSVAVAPDGTAWFGATAERGPVLAHATAAEEVSVDWLAKKLRWSSTSALRFDPQGDLWFARDDEAGSAGARQTGRSARSSSTAAES
jgi:streptogramin lyase